MADGNEFSTIDNASPEELESLLEQTLASEEEPGTEAPPDGTTDASAEGSEPPALTPEQQLKELQEKVKKQEKQLKDKDDFIHKRNADIGQLRKQLREKQQALLADEPTEEEILEDPKGAVKRALEREKQKAALDQEDQELEMEEVRIANRQIVDRMVPNLSEIQSEIAEVMTSDGIPPEMVTRFSEDPTSTLHPSVIFQISKRVEMAREIARLKAQLAEQQNQPRKLTENIEKFSKAKSPVATAPVNKGTQTTSKLKGLTEADIDKMSIEELEKLQEELS